jgi:hypothetical protein
MAADKTIDPLATDTPQDGPGRNNVVLTHPQEQGRVVFSSVSESRAKDYIERHFPRGSEAHLVTPSGETLSYESERSGDKGQDADKWAAFDPTSYVVPSQAVTVGPDEYADREG